MSSKYYPVALFEVFFVTNRELLTLLMLAYNIKREQEMENIYLIGENLLTIESLKSILLERGYDVHTGYVLEQLEIDKILNVDPDILFWDSDIIEAEESRIFDFLEQVGVSFKSIFVLSKSTASVLGYGLIHGIEGFVHKSGGIEDLEACIASLGKGKSYISPLLAGGFAPENSAKFNIEKPEESVLTKQEHKILGMVKKEKTSKEIADSLNISYKTVQNHRQNICRKLGLKGRNKLVEFAHIYFELGS